MVALIMLNIAHFLMYLVLPESFWYNIQKDCCATSGHTIVQGLSSKVSTCFSSPAPQLNTVQLLQRNTKNTHPFHFDTLQGHSCINLLNQNSKETCGIFRYNQLIGGRSSDNEPELTLLGTGYMCVHLVYFHFSPFASDKVGSGF